MEAMFSVTSATGPNSVVNVTGSFSSGSGAYPIYPGAGSLPQAANRLLAPAVLVPVVPVGVAPSAGGVNPLGSTGFNPLVSGGDVMQQVQMANEMATQTLLLQVMQMLVGLLTNGGQQSGAAGSSGGFDGGGSSAVDSGSGGGGGSSSAGSASGASGASLSSSKGANGEVSTVTRQGKKIGSSIAGAFDAMVEAAKKDGVELRISSGYRSHQEQEVLYQKYLNGTGNLAAKPGTSNHESGNAIDFANTPGAYDWLKKNAARFGLHNLPSEPWHYSIDGH